jgi:hypothetical protein
VPYVHLIQTVHLIVSPSYRYLGERHGHGVEVVEGHEVADPDSTFAGVCPVKP